MWLSRICSFDIKRITKIRKRTTIYNISNNRIKSVSYSPYYFSSRPRLQKSMYIYIRRSMCLLCKILNIFYGRARLVTITDNLRERLVSQLVRIRRYRQVRLCLLINDKHKSIRLIITLSVDPLYYTIRPCCNNINLDNRLVILRLSNTNNTSRTLTARWRINLCTLANVSDYCDLIRRFLYIYNVINRNNRDTRARRRWWSDLFRVNDYLLSR